MNPFKILLYPFSLIYKFYFVSIFGILMLLLYPLYYLILKKRKAFKTGFKIIRVHAWLLSVFGLIIVRIIDKKNIPAKGSYIICANHTSFIDIICIYIAFKDYFIFTGKKEIEKWPLFNIFYTSGMNILVDRHNRKGAFEAFKKMSKVIDDGNPLMIFPEGTISKKAPQLGSFKSGAFTIASKKQVPIIPVTFLNNWKLFQRGNLLKTNAQPGFAKMIIHPPVITTKLSEEAKEKLPDQIKEIIQAPLLN